MVTKTELSCGSVWIELNAEIVSNSKDQKQAQSLLIERDQAIRLIANANDTPKSDRYVHILKPVKAVMTYLEERNRPLPENDIVDGLTEGGWLDGTEHARTTLHKSIKAAQEHQDIRKGDRETH